MECEVVDVQDFAGEKRFVAKIVNTSVDESILDDEGRVGFAKFKPI